MPLDLATARATIPVLTDVAARSLVFVILAALAFAPWEALLGGKKRWARESPAVLTDLLFATVGQIGVRLVVVVGLEELLAHVLGWSRETPLWSCVPRGPWRTAAEIASGLLLFDLGGYLYHRLAHASPALWRLHAVHHSSAHLDWLASFREHPLEIVLITACQNAPLVLLGIPLGVHTSVIVFLRLWTVFVHADLRLPRGPWEALLATPAFHRRHHHKHGVSRNFATLFPFLDRLFDSWEAVPASEEPGEPVGLDAPLPTSFAGLLLYPFAPRRWPWR